MKLTELSPVWLERGGIRVGLMFRCPHCREAWLSCFCIGMHIWGEEISLPYIFTGQMGYIREALDRIGEKELPENWVVPCKANLAWTFSGDSFDNISITPSLDCSASGHWHGFITAGEIR